MGLKQHSIRSRFLTTALALAVVLLGLSLYAESLVEDAVRSNFIHSESHHELSEGIGDLKKTLQLTESGLYEYSYLLDPKLPGQVLDNLQHSTHLSHELQQISDNATFAQVRHTLQELHITLESLNKETRNFLEVMQSSDTRYPGMVIMINELQPINQLFTEAVTSALDDARTFDNQRLGQKIRNILADVRYYWAQQVSTVRVFAANRSGVFGEPHSAMQGNLTNREAYTQKVRELLDAMAKIKMPENYAFSQEEYLEAMRDNWIKYENVFSRVEAIYLSENWRSDMKIMRKQVSPLLRSSWMHINDIESRMKGITTDNITHSMDTSDTLTTFMWVFILVVYFALIAAYYIFEHVVRRPILQVATALEAEGSGAEPQPFSSTNIEETELLTNAFKAMQQQVHLRQKKLEIVLDNACEGIISINEQGTIQTFNKAAQILFGYHEEEIIGNHVSILIPVPARAKHDEYMKRFNESGQLGIIGKEREFLALRKDGSTFPMSIRISRTELEDEVIFTAIIEDVSERKAMLENLKQIAEHDSLTGLHNRHYFMEELERVVERALREDARESALFYIDLDNFKYANDTMGHVAGDHALVEVSELLEERVREGDLLARIGGDEFAILLYDIKRDNATKIADDIRQRLAEYSFVYKGATADVGCSVGIAMIDKTIRNKEELLAQADLACHVAKRSGRNRVHFYKNEDQKSIDDMSLDMGWSRRIKHAIENDKLIIACQPIVGTTSGNIDYYEILLRMEDENGDIIVPAGFMPSAERFGLMVDIDRWVVVNAIKMLAKQRRKNPALRFSINLSGTSVGDADMLKIIKQEIRRYNIDPTALMFEITETTAISHLHVAVKFLTELRVMGCKTALDDFGAGYSSFAYLKDLPVDHVKLDGMFVRDIDIKELHYVMVRSMNEVAHAMGKKTIAEFVENEACINRLREIGVDFCQGYHLGRPQIVRSDDVFLPAEKNLAKSEVVNLFRN